MRSCSAVMSRTSALRWSSGRSGLRASVSSWARSAVSGVRSSWPASAAKRRVASSARSVCALDSPRRASIALSAPASWRTSSGAPLSSASGVERSSAPRMRAAPLRSRASGRTASVVRPQAASAVSASADRPSSSTSRRMWPTRSSTGASELRICSRGLPKSATLIVSERHGLPAMSIVSKPVSSGTSGGLSGTSPARSISIPLDDLRERAAAAQQPLAAALTAAVRVAAAEDRVGAVAQVGVDLVAAFALDRGQQQPAREQPADADRGDRGERDPRAEAAGQPHGRSAQPTPRTVWRIRGSPACSSLRRR